MLRLPVARGCPPLMVRLDRDLPYPADQVRSVTLGYDAGRLYVDVTAEVPVAAYPAGQGPDPARVAGVDLGIIHPYAAAGPGRAGAAGVRAGDPRRVPAAPARPQGPRPGGRRGAHPSRGSAGRGGGGSTAAAERMAEARHRRRVRQAQHEAAKTVIGWAVEHRVGTLAVGDPRGVLDLDAGRRHNQRTRDWRIGHLIPALADKAEAAGITVDLVDERGTSSTCPACARRVPKPAGRVLHLPALRAGRAPRPDRGRQHRRPCGRRHHPRHPAAAGITHRRAGAHLPGVHPARRDPRRRPHHGRARGSPGRHRPAPHPHTASGKSLAATARSLEYAAVFAGRCTKA